MLTASRTATQVDPELAALIDAEHRRQHETLCLIASENHVSPAVLAATGSELCNKYSEGYPGRRYYEGNADIDRVENLAIARAKAMFGAEHANVQPYSGAPANLAVYAAFLEPGDKVLGMDLAAGGHLTHGHAVSVTGKWFDAVKYGVRRDTGRIDMDEVREIALREKPRLIICGGTAIPRLIDFEAFGAIGREVGAVVLADVSHIAGLIVGGAHPSPFPHVDVVMTTTHKTLRGPRGAMLLCKAEHAEAIDKAVFPGLQGGPHENTVAAIAQALHEAAQPEFSGYAHAIVANAVALGEGLKRRGFDLVSGGTDNHLLLVDLTPRGVTGGPAAERLDRAGIVTNRNAIPFDPRKPLDPSGLRLGTPAVTTRGLTPERMDQLAAWIDRAVDAPEPELAQIAAEVRELALAYPPPSAASTRDSAA